MEKKNKTILYTLLMLAISLFLLHGVAIAFELYWTVWWIDIVNHLLGGTIVALIGTFLWLNGKEKRAPTKKELFIFVFFIGVLWEVFEFSFGLMSVSDKGFALDTVLDLCMDILGVFVTRFLLSKHV